MEYYLLKSLLVLCGVKNPRSLIMKGSLTILGIWAVFMTVGLSVMSNDTEWNKQYNTPEQQSQLIRGL